MLGVRGEIVMPEARRWTIHLNHDGERMPSGAVEVSGDQFIEVVPRSELDVICQEATDRAWRIHELEAEIDRLRAIEAAAIPALAALDREFYAAHDDVRNALRVALRQPTADVTERK